MGKVLFIREYGGLDYNVGYDNWEALKPVTCAFTGHRPQSFPFKFNEESDEALEIKRRLREEIEQAITDDYIIFLSGAALGVDTWAALIVLELRERYYPFIRLELVLPCLGQESKWSKKAKETYAHLLDNADAVTRTSRETYFDGCMKIRNELMVMRSNRLIAVWNNKPSGTGQTVRMAHKQGLDVKVIDV